MVGVVAMKDDAGGTNAKAEALWLKDAMDRQK
jgi:hypothetical protein